MTDVGQVREINEDSYAVCANLGLAVVADGVGGGHRGDVASRTVVDTLAAHFERRGRFVFSPGENAPRWLIEAIEEANSAIHHRFGGETSATTVVAAAFIQGGVFVAHAGDSRCYRLRANHLEQLTHDHSLFNEYLKRGLLTEADREAFPLNNVMTRGVGFHENLEVDCAFHQHADGDRYLLCSDGVTDLLSDIEITQTLVQYDDNALAAQALCDQAWEAGGHDNITAVVISPLI